MTTPEFLSLLLAALAKVIPGYADMNEADRNTALIMARTLFEAFQPADVLEAARAAQAVAANLAAMDNLARAAAPGVGDATAIRLRNNAFAAARLFDAAVQARRKEQQQSARATPHPRTATSRPPVAPASPLRHRAELPLPIGGLAETVVQGSRRPDWRHSTALAAIQPTVVPGAA